MSQSDQQTSTENAEQEAFEPAKPTPEHEWLQQLVGEWTWEGESVMVPGTPPEKFGGTESVRTLGGIWIVAEGSAEHEGHKHVSVMTIGYDPDRMRFIGSFVHGATTHHWLYDGELDAARRVLTLDCEGPSMESKGMANYKDVIEIISPDERTLTAMYENANGEWSQIMLSRYRRNK